MNAFRDVIALWPSLSSLAADMGVAYGVVKQWRMRDSIPPGSWAGLIAAAQLRGFTQVSAESLTEIARIRGERTSVAAQ